MTVRTVRATRYVTPLREGGSLPAIIEADDEGMYVLKFRGAGQGPKALIAELLGAQIGRLLKLPVPEPVFVELPEDMARTEPDPEISSLIRVSAGLNFALDYLPGSITFDPLIFDVESELASQVVWFDAYLCNVDRSARNVNLLIWHRGLWLIDHGAALYFHHAWRQGEEHASTPFARIKDHVLLKQAGALQAADAKLRELLREEELREIVASIPDAWLQGEPGFDSPQAQRDAYLRFLSLRAKNSGVFLAEALRARSSHL